MADNKIYGSANRKKLYENLSKDGFDLGTYEDFDRNMNDKNVRKSIHEAAVGAGWDLPDYATFETDMAVRRLTIGGKSQEVDHATYDDFMRRHPSGTNIKPKTQPKPQPKQVSVPSAAPAAATLPSSDAEAPDSPVLRTPWGTDGSATGTSREYRSFAPGQVRETGDPGASQFGTPYKPDTQLTAAQRDELYRQNDYTVKQLKKMRDENTRRDQPIVDTGSPGTNSSVIKTQGQWEDELRQGASRISNSLVVPAIDKAISDFDKKAHEIFESGREGSGAMGGLPTGTAMGATVFGNVKESNKARDPEKILEYLKGQFEGLYNDKAFIEEVGKEADKMGMDRKDYLEEIIKPQIESDLMTRFDSAMIDRYLPRSGKEYVVSGLGNSIIGMLANAFLETKGQREYKNQAAAVTEEGKNPHYNPGTGAKLAQMGVSFAADAPFFGVYGKVSGQVAKNIAEREIKKLVGKGLSEGAARSIVGSALENSVGARMKNYLMQHVVSNSMTLGAYNATSEAARQLRDQEFDPVQLAKSTAEGLATGAAFGVTGGAVQALSQPLTGFARVGAKLGGFAAEAETLYGTEELAKMAEGDEAFTNPFEGSLEAMEKLGVMKLSGGHLLGKAAETAGAIREKGITQAAGEAVGGLLGRQRTGVEFTPEEKSYIRDTAEGRDLVESLSNMHPDMAVEEVNGKKKFTKEGEQQRRQLADNYNRFMSDTEIPSTLKSKVAQMFGGIYRPGLETGATITQNEDGSAVLKTRDKDGSCVRDMRFDSYEDAHAWQQQNMTEFSRNDAANMWNTASLQTRQNIVNTVKDDIMGTQLIADRMSQAGGMTQKRLQRELAKIDELRKQYEGREMTDDEVRNYIQTVISDGDDAVFGQMYQVIRDNAYPADELNTKRNYWEGTQMSDMDRHYALVDAQLAEEKLSLLGESFAGEVIGAAQYPDEKMAELAARGDVTKEQLESALDYYNKSAKVNGMMDQVLSGIDGQVEAANAQIRRNTHPDTGRMIEATAQGRNYYITAGHFQLSPDGRIQSADNTGMVILRDMETGEIVVMSPYDVAVTGVTDPTRLMEYNDSMDGLRGQLMRQADESIELNPETPTDAANGDIYTGNDGRMYMAIQMQDEGGNPVWAKIALDEAGNPTGEPMSFDMYEYRKAKSSEIDTAEMPHEEMFQAERESEGQYMPEDIQDVESQNQPEDIQSGAADNAGGEAGAENGTGAYNPPATALSRIPVDGEGRKVYELAKPEDTLSELTEKFGEEKAQQMISQIAVSAAKELEKLQNTDTSSITDMADLEAHEDDVAAAEAKAEYWRNLVSMSEPKENDVQTAEAAEPVTEVQDVEPVSEKAAEPEEAVPAIAPEVQEPADMDGDKIQAETAESAQKQPAGLTAEQKVAHGTVKKNIGKRLGFQNQDGTRSEIVIDSFKGDDMVEVTRYDIDADGKPVGEPYKQDLSLVDVGNSIVNGLLKPVLSVEDRLRQIYKGKTGMQNVIDVLTDDERRQMLDAVEKGEDETIQNLINELVESHREDIILNERDKRNANVSRIMDGNSSREEKLRKVRKEYQGYDDAVEALSDEAMRPTSLEEYVADLHSRQPKAGEGPLAYFSYDQDGRKVVGMQDETGYGTKSGGDANGFKPWLAPKGKGMSLQEYAETIHSQLPEAVKEQYSDQDVRNAILSVFGGAERPSDITTMLIKRGIVQAEQAARRMEEMWIDGPSYQKVADENTFAARLQRGKQSVNTEPTDSQKEAGNYKKGHISFGGYDFTIENPEGSVRRGKDATGREWEQKMNNTYGYILGKYGKDGDHLDMFINDAQDLDDWNGTVYVVDQVDPKTGRFDEHKCLYGFDSLEEAKKAYLSNYEEGWQGLGKITGVTKDGFDEWLDSSKRKMKEFADHSIAKKHMVETEHKGFDSALKQLNTRGISIDDTNLMEEYGLKDLTLSKTGDHVTLNKIVAKTRGQGNGTRFMEDLARLADERGWTLALTPGLDFGAKSKKRLTDFYKRFGFVANKGRNADFETREAMIRRPKEFLEKPENQEKVVRDAVVEHLRSIGVDVSTDWKLGQKILDDYNGKDKLSASKKRAVETASLNPKEGSPADISTADGAKIQKKLESYANKLEKVSNLRKNFLEELAEGLGATSDGSKSKYATFITKNGDKVTIRLGNHNATVSNFDYRGEDNGISIVVSRRENEGVKNNGTAHIVEAFYPEIALRKAYGKPLSEIVRSINEALNSGKYNDTTGLAEMEEVNADEIKQHKVYHGTGAEFDAFDHSHMYEGEGAQAFGYGTYVTEKPKIAEGYANTAARRKYRREHSGYGSKEIFYKGQKVDLQSINPTKMAYDLINSEGTVKKAITMAERLQGYAEDSEMKQTWQDTIDVLKDSKKSDFTAREADLTGKRYVYDVEIPDDTGDNYLNYYDKLTDEQKQQIVDRIYQSEYYRNKLRKTFDRRFGEAGYPEDERETRFDNYVKEAASRWLADTDIKTGEDLYHHLAAEYGGAQEASAILSGAGYVGIKYPTNTLRGSNRDGSSNFVIFKEPNAKITGRTKFFKTSDGYAYGYTMGGKIYIDPRIATAETPVHEYGHLYCAMKRQTDPEGWNEWKQVMLNDEVAKPIIDRVKRDYPELAKEGNEDDFAEEIITQFSGKRGSERLREIAEEVAKENGGVFGKAEAVTAMQRLKSILNRFWEGVAKMMGWKYKNANQIADKIMADMLNGVNPQEIVRDADNRISEMRSAPIFISNAMRAVEGIRQDKATPEQWLKMIEKGGGLKAGEDKWLRLSEWLNEQKDKKSLTKEEVMDYIRQNQIEIEEQGYREYLNFDDDPNLQALRQEFSQLVDKYQNEKVAVQEEMDAFNDEMSDKYGQGWYDKLDADDRKRNQDIESRYDHLNNESVEELAYSDMVDNHGDDFGMAFEVNYKGELEPQVDMYGEGLSDYAKYYLDLIEEPIDTTRLDYTTKGLENNREIALAIPTIEPYNENDQIHFGDAGGGRAVAWIRFGETTDKDGKKVLVIDEIQSKRHQDAREKGYKESDTKDKLEEARKKVDFAQQEYDNYVEMLKNEHKGEAFEDFYSELPILQREMVDSLEQEVYTASEEYEKAAEADRAIPDAPFEKNWHELAMKRMLRYAAENGYDKIAWTTGNQQAERYNLSKEIAKISVFEPGEYEKEYGEYRNIQIDPVDGEPFFINVDKDGKIISSEMEEFAGKNLSEAVGKDLSDKIMNAAPDTEFAGNDLRIGGEGMKGFYDEILPRFMNKYGKKWGVKAGEVDLPELEDNAQKMWSVDVTPEMKESVMQGQPMFQKVADDATDKTLMGVHNISEEKLKKALKQGGLANPSLAVFDTNNYAHTDYGDISLIPRSSLIDSRTGRNAGTYSGDAWTPTYPRVEKFLTKKGDKHIAQIAKEAAGGDEEMARHLTSVINDYAEDNGDHLHFLFLRQKGLNPEIRPESTSHSHEEYEKIQEIFGDGTSTMPSRDTTPEQRKALLDLMMDVYEKRARKEAELLKDADKREAYVDAMKKTYLNSLVDENGEVWFAKGDNFVYDNWRDEQRRKNPKPDWHRTDVAAQSRVDEEGLVGEYEQWKKSLLKDEDVDEKLFAGYTPDGYRRYVKNNARNASRLMNKEAETNAYNNGGVNASKAGLLKKLKSLSEIRKYRHLLKDEDYIKEQAKQASDEWFDIIHQVSDMQKISDNPFINNDYAEARLQEALAKRDPIAYLNKEYGYSIDKNSDLAADLMNFIDKAKDMPVRYFEAKFKRPVGIEEFAVAVVPTTTSPEVVKALKDAGLEVRTYEKGAEGDPNDEARIQATMDAVKGREDIMFQKTGNPEAEMTPEERQYWNKWDAAMRKWKERNAIPEDQTAAPEKPKYQQGENALDYAQRLVQWNRQKSLWQTAPKLEDYRQVREVKDNLEAAREVEKRYPDSPSAKMRRIAAEFQQIRSAMNRQKAYDKATVKAVTDFAQNFMKMGFGDNLSRGEMERMLSSVKNATGAKDIKQSVDNIMNILIDNHLRNLDYQVTKLSSVKELSKTAQGVEKQGRLELKGQRMIQAFRDAREKRMKPEQIRERMATVAEKMNRSDDEAPMWEQEYEGLSIALQYAENIEGSRNEWADLDTEYKDAVKEYKTSGRSYKAQQELLASLDQAMQENKIDRIGLYGDIIGRLQGNISESMKGAKEFVEREKQRQKHIWDMANFDLAGKDMGAMRESAKGKPANFFLQPLGTFEQMLKQFGSRNANGEGYLYDYFMRNWMDATNQAFLNEQKAKSELDAKAREVFGDKVKRWSDLYDIERNLPMMEVEVLDGEDSKSFKLTQGNLLYIYMADKMTDGRMKLRKMGIDEETVEKIKDFLDPRLVQLGDWIQNEYLPQKRTEYNKVHERMFGAPMAAIDNYFPLKVLGDARYQEQDVNVPDSETLPSTITGNIIKRTKNALPLDILHTDALSLAVEHVEDMERWAAQAEWNKDVNTLLSYTTFRNKVKNMKTIYGSGDALWNAFKDAAKMAAGTYNPSAKAGHVDKTISNIAKGVTAAKINFRVYTAFKQILSAPAFLHDVRIDDFVKNSVNPYGSWKWAMENMPVFEKRWKSRQVGDTRLMDDPTDWKLWKTNIVQMATRMGMSPNALVDGVTCAVGAKSIYEARYRKYKQIGASDEVARKRALQDAEIGYNLTQQSSEGAFVSAIQKDRTVAANMLSVFRNSSMSYTRQWVDAARNLKKRSQKGYKEDAIKFMTRQMQENFGLEEDQAKRAAELEYAREGRRDVARLLNMMFGVTVAWNLGASLPYLLIGDDDHTKKEMLTDALVKGLIAGPTEGFAAGNIYSDLIGRTLAAEQTRKAFRNEGWGAGIDEALKQGGDYEINPLPLMADIQSMIKKIGYDKYAAAQDVFNICMQSAVGVNPQTFTDMWNACMDYGAPAWDGMDYRPDGENLTRPKELALFIMRVLNAPTSSWRNKYIDELGMNAEDAKKLPYEEMAKRYAHYKHWKDAPIMGWLRGDEARQEKIGKIQKQFDKAVEERMQRLTDEELKHNVARSESSEEKRKYAKIIAQRLGISPGASAQKAGEDKWYQQLYQERMQYDDIQEDEILADKYKNLENFFKEKREEAERKSVQDLKEFNEANKAWKDRIDEAKKEAKKRMDWIRGGKWSTPSGNKGNSKNATLESPGKKQLETSEDTEAIMNNIRRWRKEALEYLMRAEQQ